MVHDLGSFNFCGLCVLYEKLLLVPTTCAMKCGVVPNSYMCGGVCVWCVCVVCVCVVCVCVWCVCVCVHVGSEGGVSMSLVHVM